MSGASWARPGPNCTARPILRAVWRYEARGIENLPPGGFVLAAGHHSNFDPWPLTIALSRTHFVRFMAKSELFWPPLSWLIRGCGGFEVRRDLADRNAVATARRLGRASPLRHRGRQSLDSLKQPRSAGRRLQA